MTVTYSLDVSTTHLGGFGKLLLRWRGSIYKLIYRELIIFVVAYYMLAMLYRLILSKYDNHKRVFESVALYCRDFSDLIPITFVLGFYVWLIIARWWGQYMNLPWPDRVVIMITAFIQGVDERGRLIRRTLARYLNIMAVLTLQATSTCVKKRFPTMDHIVEAGIITEEERLFIEATTSPHGNWFQPAVWFANLAMQARKEGRIHDDIHLKSIMDEMTNYRGCCGMLYSYDWISVPLVYTQVVTLAVYSFFAASLMGRQFLYLDDDRKSYFLDEYIPLFTIIQFFFYIGWLKTAEELINPLGDDDDDFELNYLIDRNVQVSMLVVDDLHKKYPKMEQDPFWDNLDPVIPYTSAAAEYQKQPYLGSVADLTFSSSGMEWHISEKIPVVGGPLDDIESGHEVEAGSLMDSDETLSQADGVRSPSHRKFSPPTPPATGMLRRLLSDHTKMIRSSMSSLLSGHSVATKRSNSNAYSRRNNGFRRNISGGSDVVSVNSKPSLTHPRDQQQFQKQVTKQLQQHQHAANHFEETTNRRHRNISPPSSLFSTHQVRRLRNPRQHNSQLLFGRRQISVGGDRRRRSQGTSRTVSIGGSELSMASSINPGAPPLQPAPIGKKGTGTEDDAFLGIGGKNKPALSGGGVMVSTPVSIPRRVSRDAATGSACDQDLLISTSAVNISQNTTARNSLSTTGPSSFTPNEINKAAANGFPELDGTKLVSPHTQPNIVIVKAEPAIPTAGNLITPLSATSSGPSGMGTVLPYKNDQPDKSSSDATMPSDELVGPPVLNSGVRNTPNQQDMGSVASDAIDASSMDHLQGNPQLQHQPLGIGTSSAPHTMVSSPSNLCAPGTNDIKLISTPQGITVSSPPTVSLSSSSPATLPSGNNPTSFGNEVQHVTNNPVALANMAPTYMDIGNFDVMIKQPSVSADGFNNLLQQYPQSSAATLTPPVITDSGSITQESGFQRHMDEPLVNSVPIDEIDGDVAITMNNNGAFTSSHLGMPLEPIDEWSVLETNPSLLIPSMISVELGTVEEVSPSAELQAACSPATNPVALDSHDPETDVYCPDPLEHNSSNGSLKDNDVIRVPSTVHSSAQQYDCIETDVNQGHPGSVLLNRNQMIGDAANDCHSSGHEGQHRHSSPGDVMPDDVSCSFHDDSGLGFADTISCETTCEATTNGSVATTSRRAEEDADKCSYETRSLLDISEVLDEDEEDDDDELGSSQEFDETNTEAKPDLLDCQKECAVMADLTNAGDSNSDGKPSSDIVAAPPKTVSVDSGMGDGHVGGSTTSFNATTNSGDNSG